MPFYVVVRNTIRFVAIAIVGCTLLNALNIQDALGILWLYIITLPAASTADMDTYPDRPCL